MEILHRSLTSLATELNAAKAQAVEQVNGLTDTVRRRFITPIAGQEMIYLNKEQEALRYLAEATPPEDLTDYPFLASEIGATGATALEVATIFKMRGQAWRDIGTMIERLRVRALTDIAAAADLTTVAVAVGQFAQDMEEMV